MNTSTNAWKLVWIAAIGYFVDLFDSFLLPVFRVETLQSLGISSADSLSVYASVMNWQLSGMVLGAFFLWGPMADRYGRKTVLLGSISLYTIGSFLTAFVQDVQTFSLIRLITGIGLGGELGVGITLIAEVLPQNKRSIGAVIVGLCGMLGVVTASLLATLHIEWRTAYFIGGILGLAILILREGFNESQLFQIYKETHKQLVKQQNFWHALKEIFSSGQNIRKYISCILVGTPTFFVGTLLIAGAPEFGKALNMKEIPSPATALMIAYIFHALGDMLCGYYSQRIASRKYALLTFHFITLIGIASFVIFPPIDPQGFYFRCALAGFGIGYWSSMVLNSAEQFGTNIRATVTVTVPNLVRFLFIPISATYWAIKPYLGFLNTITIIGGICSFLAITAVLCLKDEYHKNLDFLEKEKYS